MSVLQLLLSYSYCPDLQYVVCTGFHFFFCTTVYRNILHCLRCVWSPYPWELEINHLNPSRHQNPKALISISLKQIWTGSKKQRWKPHSPPLMPYFVFYRYLHRWGNEKEERERKREKREGKAKQNSQILLLDTFSAAISPPGTLDRVTRGPDVTFELFRVFKKPGALLNQRLCPLSNWASAAFSEH